MKEIKKKMVWSVVQTYILLFEGGGGLKRETEY